jgi:hypothetical protein
MSEETDLWQVMVGTEVFQGNSAEIKQWIAEGRLQATDKIKKGSLAWIDASRVPAFRDSFANAPAPAAASAQPFAPAAENYYNPAQQALPGTPVIQGNQVANYVEQIRHEENFGMALVAGSAAAMIGALLWGIITAVTNYRIGFMAMGIGVLVGFAVQKFGKGIDTKFGVAGAVLSLLGCMVGNILAVLLIVAQLEGVSFLTIFFNLGPGMMVTILQADFSPIDLLFYGLAIYEGYRFSFRRDTETAA